MPKFVLDKKKNENEIENIKKLVNKFNDGATFAVNYEDHDGLVSNLKVDYNKIIEMMEKMDVPENEEEFSQLVDEMMKNVIASISLSIQEAYVGKRSERDDIVDFQIMKRTIDLTKELTYNLSRVIGSGVKNEKEMNEFFEEMDEDMDEEYEEYFKSEVSRNLRENPASMFEMKMEKALNTMNNGTKEERARCTNSAIESLSTQIGEYKNFLKGKDAKNTVSNLGFEEFLSTCGSEYRMVHDLYNRKNFFQKWFTSEGRALRSAMNDAKDTAKKYYKMVAKKNDETLMGKEYEKGKYKVVPTKKKDFDASAEFKYFSTSKKMEIELGDNLGIKGKEVIVSAFDKEQMNIASSRRLTESEQEDLDARMMDQSMIEDLENDMAKTDSYNRSKDEFWNDLDELERKNLEERKKIQEAKKLQESNNVQEKAPENEPEGLSK